MKKRCFIKTVSVLIAALIMWASGRDVLAAGLDDHAAKQPDYDRKGSVTVEIRETDGSAVSGGTITSIPVADAVYENGDNFFVLKEDFEGSGTDLSRIGAEENGAPELAAELAAYAEEKGLEGTTKQLDGSGKAVFENLDLGLYLFVQRTPAEKYESVRPFLVTVPLWNGKELVYDVEAGPKAGTVTGYVFIEPCGEKVLEIKRGTPKKKETFTFRMVPGQKDQPMPELEGSVKDPETGAITLTHGTGTFSFGKIWFAPEDIGKTYTYKISEIKGTDPRITYDLTVYTMTVRVNRNADTGKIECDVSISGKGDAETSAVVFTNIFDTPPDLPKTGQLWWPVPVLFLAGILFMGIGLFAGKRKG